MFLFLKLTSNILLVFVRAEEESSAGFFSYNMAQPCDYRFDSTGTYTMTFFNENCRQVRDDKWFSVYQNLKW
jgi:hypothetical protein